MEFKLTDQPGRILAVFVIAPILLYKGYIYQDKFIIAFAVILFFWDLYWLFTQPARSSTYNNSMQSNYMPYDKSNIQTNIYASVG